MRKIDGFYQKTVDYSGKRIKLYSTNGVNWSTEKTDLSDLASRIQQTKETVASRIGGTNIEVKVEGSKKKNS